jgi:primosomal replication protein N
MEIKYKKTKRLFEILKVGDTFTCEGFLFVKCHPASNQSFNAFNLETCQVTIIDKEDRISPCNVTIIVE